MLSRREQHFLFLAVALPVWLVLVCLLPLTVTRGGDCGELIAASYRLGIPHPSGYPVWCLLGRLFAFLPWGEIAWRYNLFSSVCGACAAGFIALAAYRVAFGLRQHSSESSFFLSEPWLLRWSAVGAGFLFAGAYHIGSQFIIAEVYSGAALVGAALLYLFLKWHQEGDCRDLFTLAFLSGLSLAVHLSALFILPWVAFTALWKRGLNGAQLGWVLLLGVVGFSPVLYLPIRSAAFPAPASNSLDSYFYAPLDWGHPATPTAFKNQLTGAQYRKLLIETKTSVQNGQKVTTKQLAQSPTELPRRLSTFGLFTFMQFLWATPLLLVGFVALFRAERRVFWPLLLIAGSNLGVEINYDVADQTNFFFPTYLVMTLWAGAGWFVLLRFLARRNTLVATAGPLLVLSTLLSQWSLFIPNASLRHVTRVRDGSLEQAHAMQGLARRTKRPVFAILPADDLLWAFWYVKYALGVAPDVETPWGRLVNDRYTTKKLASYVAQLRKQGPVCLGVWDDAVDARFPLVMISPSGNTCLASTRRLPEPAKSLSPTDLSALNLASAPNGLLSGRFRRANLWKSSNGLPNVSASGTAAFEVDFSAPEKWTPTPQDVAYGRIEVLMAQTGHFKTPPKPTQNTVSRGEGADKTKTVFVQRRRLVLPARVRPQQLLRAAVPLAVETAPSIGTYDVWTRLVLPTDKSLPNWTRTDRVSITQK